MICLNSLEPATSHHSNNAASVVVSVAPDDGTGQPGEFTIVFVWGDENMHNNGTVSQKYLPEIPNRRIWASDLYNETGIGIDIEQNNGAAYRFVRIRTYPPSLPPKEDEFAQVNAIERVNTE